jgi:hypothetical protein
MAGEVVAAVSEAPEGNRPVRGTPPSSGAVTRGVQYEWHQVVVYTYVYRHFPHFPHVENVVNLAADDASSVER